MINKQLCCPCFKFHFKISFLCTLILKILYTKAEWDFMMALVNSFVMRFETRALIFSPHLKKPKKQSLPLLNLVIDTSTVLMTMTMNILLEKP